jgi:hypothetical protein
VSNLIEPGHLAKAVESIYSELPALFGEKEWPEAERMIRDRLAVIANVGTPEPEAIEASMDLVRLLSRFPDVRERVRSQLAAVQLADAFCDVIGEQGTEVLAFFRLEEPDQASLRRVVINPDGTGGGATRKLANLRLDSRRLLDILTDTASGAIVAITGHQLAIVTGVLSVLRAINKAITVDLTEKDARVFCELVLARADKVAVSESVLLETANQHRRTMGIAEITLPELRVSLCALEQIHCVARTPEIPDQWSIVESYHVRDIAGRS